MSCKEIILNNVKLRRKGLNLTQEKIAKELDINVHQYQKYERGITKIPSPLLFKLSKVLNVDMNYFASDHQCNFKTDSCFVNEAKIKYDSEDKLLNELILVLKGLKNQNLRKKILTMAKLIASEENSLIQDKYD